MHHPPVLVVVHPFSACAGPAYKLRQLSQALWEAEGPVLVLSGGQRPGYLSDAQKELIDALDGVELVSFDADEEGAGLECGTNELIAHLKQLPDAAEVHLSGAWAEHCVATVLASIEAAGISARVLPHAVATCDTDDESEASPSLPRAPRPK